jgi:hypothetical protein
MCIQGNRATEVLPPPLFWQAFQHSKKERPMFRRMIVPALAAAALLSGAAWAQTMAQTAAQTTAQTTAQTAKDDDGSQAVMQRIHDELTAQGFKDVKVVPSAFIVSGKNKDGTPVMMLIGPNSMTVLTPADSGESPQGLQQDDNRPDWQ